MLLFLKSIFSEHTLNLLSAGAFWLTLITFLVALLRWRLFSGTQRNIAFVVGLTLLNHSLTWFLMSIKESNLWVYHLFVPSLFILMTRIYSQELREMFSRRVFDTITLVFVLLAIVNALFFQGVSVLNPNIIRLMDLVFVGYGVLYFYSMINSIEGPSQARSSMIWFNSGVITYYSGTLILFLLVDTILIDEEGVLIASWVLNAIFNLFLLTSYGIALCLKVHK